MATMSSAVSYSLTLSSSRSRRFHNINHILRRSKRFVSLASSADRTATLESASDVVRKFYGGINGRDLSSVEGLISLDCVYEDLVFPRPFVGRKVLIYSYHN